MSSVLAFFVVATLQAAPAAPSNEVAVLLTRRVDLPRLTAGEIVSAVGAVVEAEQVRLLSAAKIKAAKLGEPDLCAGQKDCVLRLAQRLGVAVVIGVQVGNRRGRRGDHRGHRLVAACRACPELAEGRRDVRARGRARADVRTRGRGEVRKCGSGRAEVRRRARECQ